MKRQKYKLKKRYTWKAEYLIVAMANGKEFKLEWVREFTELPDRIATGNKKYGDLVSAKK